MTGSFSPLPRSEEEVGGKSSCSPNRRWYARPAGQVAAGLAAALVLVPVVLARPAGPGRDYLLYYVLPVGVPFVAWGLDRLATWRRWRVGHRAIDAVVVAVSLSRAFTAVLPASGHALFLTYAVGTAGGWAVRLTALAVLVQVAYLKLWAWGDPTFWPGVALGVVAIVSFRALPARP